MLLHGRIMIVGIRIDWQRHCGQTPELQSPILYTITILLAEISRTVTTFHTCCGGWGINHTKLLRTVE
jgi:hypothetical protein